MLKNSKNLYIIFAGPYIGLAKIGDEVRFNMKKTLFSVHDHDVNNTSFVNLTLDTEQ